MEGLPIFNEIFATIPPAPLETTATDGAFHVEALNANKLVDPKILAMWTATHPLYDTFMVDKTKFDKGEGDLKLMNAAFDVLEKGLNSVFTGYQQTIVGIYKPETDKYKELFFMNISDMFRGGISVKLGNVRRFLLACGSDVKLAAIKADLILKQSEITTKQSDKTLLKAQVEAMGVTVRASQKIFCQEEEGNAGTLRELNKTNTYLCNQYFLVTDIKHYKPTAIAIAKKEALIHEFAKNTITIVENVLLSPSCKPNIKSLSMEGVKLGSAYNQDSALAANYPLEAGKTFKKNIKYIGAVGNTLLVVDTTGNTASVKLRIEIK